MDKKLIIIRHAKSDWNTGLLDYERPLNSRGKRDAPNVGLYLKELGVSPDLVISSSAERAINTAVLICHSLEFPMNSIKAYKELYHAVPKTYLKFISELTEDIKTVILVGHNPGISDFVSYLTDDACELKTCCVAILEVKVALWEELFQGTCILNQYISPKEIL